MRLSRRICAWIGKACVGFAFASLIQAVTTCFDVTPADASRWSAVAQQGHDGEAHSLAVTPPCAASTMVNSGFFVGSESANGLNAENSCVVFDMPIEMNTDRPLALG